MEAIKQNGLINKTKFYQASSSELFGRVNEVPQNENTPFNPLSPYATAKLYAYWITVNYRESYGIFGSNGILFNHESPRRGNSFISKKIVESVKNIKIGISQGFKVGNIHSQRGWGYAPEYVEAMWKMLQLESPTDLVISTGETNSVKSFIDLAFSIAGYNLIWEGKDLDQKGYCSKTNKALVQIDPYYFRPNEVDILLGDSSLAKLKIGWSPEVKFKSLVQIMMEHELNNLNID